MKSTFVGQRVNFLGPVTLIVGKKKIAGEAMMCGTLYVEVAASTGFSAVSSSTAFRPSDISGNFTPTDPKALTAIKSGEAEVVWKNRGKETTLPISVTEVRIASIKFVARKP
ncbi:MAG: hypothetical protein PHU43_02955 [Candidatus Bipolaricaulis sp.]|nr:hypothetical protein [Candidatus Bipolaricaulis sp.]